MRTKIESYGGVCVLRGSLRDSSEALVIASVVCETQIEFTIVKTLFADLIERPLLKARPGDVAQEYWVNSLLNLLCFMCLSIIVFNCFNVYVFRNLIDPLHKIT